MASGPVRKAERSKSGCSSASSPACGHPFRPFQRRRRQRQSTRQRPPCCAAPTAKSRMASGGSSAIISASSAISAKGSAKAADKCASITPSPSSDTPASTRSVRAARNCSSSLPALTVQITTFGGVPSASSQLNTGSGSASGKPERPNKGAPNAPSCRQSAHPIRQTNARARAFGKFAQGQIKAEFPPPAPTGFRRWPAIIAILGGSRMT